MKSNIENGVYMKDKKWYKLDNVGKFYASISTKEIPSVFRYCVVLKDEIDEQRLQEALDNTIDIYPNFNVNLKKGFFWYYLEESNRKVIVTKENLPICYRIYNNSDDFLYRVSYYKNKINLEISHILSDGMGSKEFFKVLVSNYIKLRYSIKKLDIVTSNSYTEKAEDSFLKYHKKPVSGLKEKNTKIYMYKGKKLKKDIRYMDCHLSLKEVISLAHNYNATLTSFLVSLLIYSFRNILSSKDLKKTIKIDIPVDLRKYFNSTSSKNFFGVTFITYKFTSNKDSLSDIINCVNNQFKEKITIENLSSRVNTMVSFEKNFLCRAVPIPIKNFVLKIFNSIYYQRCTSSVSNLGKMEFNSKVCEYIDSVSVLASTTGFQFTICSFDDDLSIGISTKYKYNDVIKDFCRYFSKKGINIDINVSEVD